MQPMLKRRGITYEEYIRLEAEKGAAARTTAASLHADVDVGDNARGPAASVQIYPKHLVIKG